MATATPWGQADAKEKIDVGVNFYFTPSHGGICVSKKKAETLLTESARKVAIKYGNGYWFEEDCNFVIPLYENSTWLKKFNEGIKKPLTVEYLEESIKRWNKEYWEERKQEKHEVLSSVGL
jgi:hypothetical protein